MREDAPRNPGLEHVLDLLNAQLLDAVRISVPGVIESYDADRQSAHVSVGIREAYDDELGERRLRTVRIDDVPVMFLGHDSGRITWPVNEGDGCWIWFSGRSLERWKQLGGIVDPGDDRKHDPSDAICVVGGHAPGKAPSAPPTDAIVTHGTTRIGGPDASSAIVVQDALTTFGIALNVAIVAMTGPPLDPAVTALQQLATALGIAVPGDGSGWSAGTSEAFAK